MGSSNQPTESNPMKSILRTAAFAFLALGFVAAPASVFAGDKKCSACEGAAKTKTAKKKAKKQAKPAAEKA